MNGPPAAAEALEIPESAPATRELGTVGRMSIDQTDSTTVSSMTTPRTRPICWGAVTSTSQTPTGVVRARASMFQPSGRQTTWKFFDGQLHGGQQHPGPDQCTGHEVGSDDEDHGAETTLTPKPTAAWTKAPTSSARPSSSSVDSATVRGTTRP